VAEPTDRKDHDSSHSHSHLQLHLGRIAQVLPGFGTEVLTSHVRLWRTASNWKHRQKAD
jgi:hypothetical protein